ncbi:hypothetical protein H5410_003081 [Solanum commersonii]|uniref:Uncharacterized protein n=1 Tax=Solanum commersonii TaxID=4109 RepID=A0A9J6B407_SOLCO|nr:hypothetical protein H5410_003081 [Solanum commersonii]
MFIFLLPQPYRLLPSEALPHTSISTAILSSSSPIPSAFYRSYKLRSSLNLTTPSSSNVCPRFGFTSVATSSDTLWRKACEEMSCNQPNKLSRTKEQTLKEPPSVNIQENASNQITTSTCSSNKAKQLFPPFYAFEKGSTSNTCKAQQNVIPEVIYISGSTSNTCSEQQNLTPKVATKKG